MSAIVSENSKRWILAAFAALALGASASEAKAAVTVCNNYSSEIRFTATINDASACSGSWHQIGWWAIPAFQCRTLTGLGNMTNKTLYSFIRALDGTEWNGGGSNSWWVPNGAFNGCKSNFQLQCSNAGADCLMRSHRKNSFTRKDVTITVAL